MAMTRLSGRVCWELVALVAAAAMAASQEVPTPDPCAHAKELRQQVKQLATQGQSALPQYRAVMADFLKASKACRASRGDGGAHPPTVRPGQFLRFVSRLPVEQRKQALVDIGRGLVESGDTQCNLFGGESSCMTLPSDSAFARLCPDHPLKVDCALYDESLSEVNDDPIAEAEAEMTATAATPCPICIDNLRSLWCYQTVPKCGSFQSAVEGHVLPALADSAAKQDAGASATDAAVSAVPTLFAAISKMWPCRAMCEDVVESCGCGKDKSFGDLLTLLSHRNKAAAVLVSRKHLLDSVWSEPLCSLYASHGEEGFVGHCPMLRQSHSQCDWCGEDGDVPDYVEELIADFAARTITGLASGLVSPLKDLAFGEDDWEDSFETQKAEHDAAQVGDGGDAPSSTHHGALVLLISIVVAIVLGGAAFAGYSRWRQAQGRAVQMPAFLSKYTPLAGGPGEEYEHDAI